MEIADLKQRDEAIWQKYCQNVDEDDLVAIYRQGMFLGIYEQLVRILRRNTENVAKDYRNSDFFKLALVTYVDLYCRILVQREFAAEEQDIAAIAISAYYNKDYDEIIKLPQSAYGSENATAEMWVRYMRSEIIVWGVRNLALLDVINGFYYRQYGKLMRFEAAEKYIPGYGRGAFSVCNRNLRILKAKGIILRNVIYELSDHLF